MDLTKNHRCLKFVDCKFCNKKISTNILPRHEVVCYMNPINIKHCVVCGKIMENYKRDKCSKECRTKDPYKCKYCNVKNFTTEHALVYHEKTCHLNPNNIRHCPVCGDIIEQSRKRSKTCSEECSKKYSLGYFVCKYCNKNIDLKIKSIECHEKTCKLNSVRIEKPHIACEFCKKQIPEKFYYINRHNDTCKLNPKNMKYCLICKSYYTNRKSDTCSKKCHNESIILSNLDYQKILSYIIICFYFHKKECIICKEENIVHVHHFDGNHKNNNPENLVPLCGTHHGYMHHKKFRKLIVDKIIIYITNFKTQKGIV